MGPAPSKIHTEACQKWLDAIYHEDEKNPKSETPELREEHKRIMLEIKEEWDLLDTFIEKGREKYNELPFPDCGAPEELERIVVEYKEVIPNMVGEDPKSICHELKQNTGFNLLDFEMKKKMLEKVIAVEDLPFNEMRITFKKSLGTFTELSFPFMEKYELQNFPAALAMFGQGNLHRLG